MLDTRKVFASLNTEWTLPADLPYLDGHFPGQPVFPAVGIVDASVELVRKKTGVSSLYLNSVVSAKFTAPIGPGTKVHIEAAKVADAEGGANGSAVASGSAPANGVGNAAGQWQIDWHESGAPEKKLASLRLELLKS